ncbi:MAG: hypothetical protein AABZ00_12400 [Chloroflexota bacterium]
MTNLNDLYTDFFRIDMDARGGYARVADVVSHQADGTLIHRAFKLMRDEFKDKQVGMERFENELRILIEITNDRNAPPAITRVYDSGFAPVELSRTLHNLHDAEKLTPNLQIVSTGVDIRAFLEMKSALMEKGSNSWVPYLVVDLAPYSDSLLRQIKPQSATEFLNLYRLPVDTIIEMALQLTDVIEYLHKRLRYTYIDWKPEHIYWNGPLKQLKVIDWNVTHRLKDNPKEKQLVREDIRMLCGAALYCSLALTDPEDQGKSIGLAPDYPKNLWPSLGPRYWTDRPNFYERDAILGEKIKVLVRKGLDPNQGFNSPKELKNSLNQYLEQNDTEHGEAGDLGVNVNLPLEAVQHYRRARSYIAAEDYTYAVIALEVAIETARVAGMNYPDAASLLTSVQNILKVGEVRQKVKLALDLGAWQEAIKLYEKSLDLDPENITPMKKEYNGLQSLLTLEAELRNKGIIKFFTKSYQLQYALKSTEDIVNPGNLLYTFVKRQYNKIRLIQFGGMLSMLVIVVFASLSTGNFRYSPLFLGDTATATYTLTSIPSMTITKVVATPEPTLTFTVTPTATVTDTPLPVATPTVIPRYGVLTVSFFYPVEEPNGKRIEPSLKLDQFVTIVEEKKDSNDVLWYKCVWETEGVPGIGWILADDIRFAPPPTTSTP